MKKRLFFYIVGVVALIAGAISCTNNDFEESIPQEQPKRTRAVRTMTADEVQARLDEIGEKYGTNINLLYVRDYSNLNEDIFKAIEQQITTGQTRTIDKMDGENLVDESSLDEYGIAMLSTEIEEESKYDDELNFDIAFLDPPYHAGIMEDAIERVSPHIADGGIIVCETGERETLPEDIEGFTSKRYKYGKIALTVYRKGSS